MRRLRGALVPIILFIVLPAVGLGVELWLRGRTVPPQSVTTMDSFMRWRPETTEFVAVTGPSGGQHVLAYGSLGGQLASGPSAYVFDRSGRMVDRTTDIGDDGTFQRQWRPVQPLRRLPTEEAIDWTKGDAHAAGIGSDAGAGSS